MAIALQITLSLYNSGEDCCGFLQHLVFIETYLLHKALLCRVARYNNMLNRPSFFCTSILRTTHYTELCCKGTMIN